MVDYAETEEKVSSFPAVLNANGSVIAISVHCRMTYGNIEAHLWYVGVYMGSLYEKILLDYKKN